MRKLAVLAVLALSLFTVACTESEDVGTGDEAASIDDVGDLSIDSDVDSVSERGVPRDGVADTASRLGGNGTVVPPNRRTAMEEAADPISDRIGPGAAYVPPTRPRAGDATGSLECFTPSKAYSNEPIVSEVSSAELGRRAQIRLEAIRKFNGKAPAIRLERVGAPTKL